MKYIVPATNTLNLPYKLPLQGRYSPSRSMHVDIDNERISLSIKATLPDENVAESDSETTQSYLDNNEDEDSQDTSIDNSIKNDDNSIPDKTDKTSQKDNKGCFFRHFSLKKYLNIHFYVQNRVIRHVIYCHSNTNS